MRFDESGAKPDSEYAAEFKAVGGLVGRLAINDITSFAEIIWSDKKLIQTTLPNVTYCILMDYIV